MNRDSCNDERRNYLFVVNPLGVQMDTIEHWPSGDTPWDRIWDSAAAIGDRGWSAEIAIPFSTLRFQRSEAPQVWGFDAIRGYPRNVFHQMGSFPRDRSDNCYLCQAHKIEGFAGVSPGRNVELVPTLTASRTDNRSELPDGPLVAGDFDSEIGLTALWGFTPNLTLSGTLNPDFSQVEADALQLEVNRTLLHVCGKPNGHSHLWFNVHFGGQVDYDNVRDGDFTNINGGPWYRFGRHLLIEPSVTRERMEVAEGRLDTSAIGQLTASWQFNPRTFIRAILQYSGDRFHTELYSDGRAEERESVFSQLLFSYKVNPRTVLFVGYSDTALGSVDFGLTKANRTLFGKVGYAWVF